MVMLGRYFGRGLGMRGTSGGLYTWGTKTKEKYYFGARILIF